MVREFRENRDAPLVVLVDAYSPRTVAGEWDEPFELALSFAATVCVSHLRQSRDASLLFGVHGRRRRCGGRAECRAVG